MEDHKTNIEANGIAKQLLLLKLLYQLKLILLQLFSNTCYRIIQIFYKKIEILLYCIFYLFSLFEVKTMSISAQKQPQALLDLELYLNTVPKPHQTLQPSTPPPPPPPPISAQKPAIFDTGESKKRYGEAVTQDEKESEKRLKVTQVAPVALVTQVAPVALVTQVAPVAQVAQVAPNVPKKPSKCIYTIIFSNNKKMIQLPVIITPKIENEFINHLSDGISIFNNDKHCFDKAFDKATLFLNILMKMNIKPVILTIGTNDDVVTDTAGLHISYDFIGSNKTVFVYRFSKMTNIDTFDKQVISEIKNNIGLVAKQFATNTKSFANFAESDARQAKHDLNTAQENAIKANRDFNTAQENAAKAKRDLNTVLENASSRKPRSISNFDIVNNVFMAHKNVITAQENVITAQEKSAAAQKNVTTAREKSSAADADVILTRDKALNAAKDAEIKTKDARNAEINTKDEEKINLPKVQRIILNIS